MHHWRSYTAIEHAFLLGDVDVVRTLMEHGARLEKDWPSMLLQRPIGPSNAQDWLNEAQAMFDMVIQQAPTETLTHDAWLKLTIEWVKTAKSVIPLSFIQRNVTLDWGATCRQVSNAWGPQTVLSAALGHNNFAVIQEVLKLGARTLPNKAESPWAVFIGHRVVGDAYKPTVEQKALRLAENLAQHECLNESLINTHVFNESWRQDWWRHLRSAWREQKVPSAWWALVNQEPASPTLPHDLALWLACPHVSVSRWTDSRKRAALDVLMVRAMKEDRPPGSEETALEQAVGTLAAHEILRLIDCLDSKKIDTILRSMSQDFRLLRAVFQRLDSETREKVLTRSWENVEVFESWLKLGRGTWPARFKPSAGKSLGCVTLVEYAIMQDSGPAALVALREGCLPDDATSMENLIQQTTVARDLAKNSDRKQVWNDVVVLLTRLALQRHADRSSPSTLNLKPVAHRPRI